MSSRRRTYSGLEGWLMSGEVLYCGNLSNTNELNVATGFNPSDGSHLIWVEMGWTPTNPTAKDSVSDGNYVKLLDFSKITNGDINIELFHASDSTNENGDYPLIYCSYIYVSSSGTSLTFRSRTSYDISLLVIAIPRTDV